MGGYNSLYGSQNFYGSQPMFPQPNGNVYVISNSLEVANVPAGAGITAALCMNENILYVKTVQNGSPTFLAYKLSPYTEAPKVSTSTIQPENDTDARLATIEKQLATLLNLVGGKQSDESKLSVSVSTPVSSASPPAATQTEWG